MCIYLHLNIYVREEKKKEILRNDVCFVMALCLSIELQLIQLYSEIISNERPRQSGIPFQDYTSDQ